MPSTPKVRAPLARTGMRDKIKKVATELLIKHGFHGMSFRDVAERCDITTTNIHYHFGSKQQLVEEIVADYVEETGARHRPSGSTRTGRCRTSCAASWHTITSAIAGSTGER